MLLARFGGSSGKLYVDDVFSAHPYLGNGSTQTVNNGIDLAGKGGLVIRKRRDSAADWNWIDSARGITAGSGSNQAGRVLKSNLTNAEANNTSGSGGPYDITSFDVNGFSIGPDWNGNGNTSGGTYVALTFRKAPKFFDIVTYVGNGAATNTIAHSLGGVPGMIILKRIDTTGSWCVAAGDSSGNYNQLSLQSSAASAAIASKSSIATASTFNPGYMGVNFDAVANVSGGTYVAYLFAHDTSPDGIIQCGSFTTDGSGNAAYNHGWLNGAQFCKIKASSGAGDWEMFDTARTPAWSSSDARLRANLNSAEDAVTRLSASGTSLNFTGLSANTTYVGAFIVAP